MLTPKALIAASNLEQFYAAFEQGVKTGPILALLREPGFIDSIINEVEDWEQTISSLSLDGSFTREDLKVLINSPYKQVRVGAIRLAVLVSPESPGLSR